MDALTASAIKGKSYGQLDENFLFIYDFYPYYIIFKENKRSYNSDLSMCALVDDSQGRGLFFSRVQNQCYHRALQKHPLEDQQKQFAQLYAADSFEVTAVWNHNAVRKGRIPEVMHKLDEIIRDRTLQEVEYHEEQHGQREYRPFSSREFSLQYGSYCWEAEIQFTKN